jgi:carbon-monoxide dehydrogenase large subunit
MSELAERTPVATPSLIGSPELRKEDEVLLRGEGRFVDDVEPRGVLHMALARCPYPYARIVSIDVSQALMVEGVVQILLGPDVVKRTEPISMLRPVPGAPQLPYYGLADGVALFEGQPVVSVVATSRHLAEDAVELLDIDYEPLEQVSDVHAAMAEGAPKLHDLLDSNLFIANPRATDNVEATFAEADVVLHETFNISRVTGLPMEGRGVLAEYSPAHDAVTVRTSTQTPHLVRKQLAESLRVDDDQVRVIATNVGGGFGLKLGIYPEDIVACVHAKDLGRPVKWIEDRSEHFRSTTHARESEHRAAIAATEDGRIVGLRNVYSVDLGAFYSPFGSQRLTTVVFQGPYHVREAYTERRIVVTNKTPTGAYRGYGQPESNFARELLVDRLARRLGRDPLDLRLQNMVPPEALPWETPGGALYDSGDYSKPLMMAAERIGYADFRTSGTRRRADGRYLGIGLSSYVEKTGYPSSKSMGEANAAFGAHESVTLRATRSGGLELYTGASSFGQGTETMLAQVVAEVTGVDYERIRVFAGDTRATPQNGGGFSSRLTIAGSGAARDAAIRFRDKALRVAAYLLDVDEPSRLRIEGRVVRDTDDPANEVSFAHVAEMAITGHRIPDGCEPGLEATAYFDPQASAFAFGSAAALVSVDAETGDFDVERFVFVHDCGTQINPLLVEGQVRGALAQGFGAALFEELRYDPDSGQLVNGTMMDYFVPSAMDLPDVELDHTEYESPVTPYGVRGVGESGTIPPGAAIGNAIYDALSDFEVRIDRLPLTPERVWRAISASARMSNAPEENAQ